MAQFHGKDGIVKIGGVTVAEVKGWNFDYSTVMRQINEPTLSDSTPDLAFAPGERSGTGAMDVLWDDTDTTGQEAIMALATGEQAAVTSVELYPEGDAALAEEYSMDVYFSTVGVAGTVDSMTTRNFSFQITGGVTTDQVSA